MVMVKKILHAPFLFLIYTGITSVGVKSVYFRSDFSFQCLTVRDSLFENGTPVELLVFLMVQAREFMMMTTDKILILRNWCNNPISQKWERDSREISIIDTDPDHDLQPKVKFCLDAKTGQYCLTAQSYKFSKIQSWIVDAGSPVVIWKCNEDRWQDWNHTATGAIELLGTGASLTTGTNTTYSCADSS